MKDKNIVFMGTPDFSLPVLDMLIKCANVVMVVTQPDKLVGRKQEKVESPVKKKALEESIPVFQPDRIRQDYEALKGIDIDLIVTCAYGQILPKEVLEMPKYGCVNVHASLLPKYRGSAPIQWALFNADKTTGVTIMYMDEGMDTGDIIEKAEINIEEADNVGTLHDKLSILGASTLENVLPSLFDGSAKREKQAADFTMAPMIKRCDEKLDFNLTGKEIMGRIKGMNPWPLANIMVNNLEIKVLDAEFNKSDVSKIGKIIFIKKEMGITCKDGIIYLKKVKPSGKKIMDITSFINGIDKNTYKEVDK